MKEKQKGPEGTTYKGNEVSTGTSLTGVDKLQHDKYRDEIIAHIHRKWQLPEWLAKKPLSADLRLKFDQDGNILERRLERSSGNEQFDKEVLQAVDAAAPLPKPPEALISYYKFEGIGLRFPE